MRKWIDLVENTSVANVANSGSSPASKKPYSTLDMLSKIPANLTDEQVVKALEVEFRSSGKLTRELYAKLLGDWRHAEEQSDFSESGETFAFMHVLVHFQVAGKGLLGLCMAFIVQRGNNNGLSKLIFAAVKNSLTPTIDKNITKAI